VLRAAWWNQAAFSLAGSAGFGSGPRPNRESGDPSEITNICFGELSVCRRTLGARASYVMLFSRVGFEDETSGLFHLHCVLG